MGKIIGIIVLIVVVLGMVFVVGPCVYYGFIEKPGEQGTVDLPDSKKATDSFYIENTGGLILSSDYEQHGDIVGKRLFVLHGFWEMRGNKFKYVDATVALDENIFGKITVSKR